LKLTNLVDQKQGKQRQHDFLLDVINGLSRQPKAIPAKYFYDDQGSELFQKISQHPDYYPTKTEFSILKDIASTLPDIIKQKEIDIIELGVGDGHKSRLIIDGFLNQQRQVNYYPTDISEKAMHLLGEHIHANDQLNIHGVIADYFTGLQHLREASNNTKLVLFLGSNIGNLTPEQTDAFLNALHHTLNIGDYVLIGFDLIKDTQVLNQAYNDADGLTAAFNQNLLTRINRELGGHFNINQFEHYGFYNPTQRAMESYLISLTAQDVIIDSAQQSFHFGQYEAMHLEYSYKFNPHDIQCLAANNQFAIQQHFSDKQHYFIDALWQVKES